MIYFTSDTHFGHSNIIELCNRPFSNVDEMNEVLINNWNETVTKDDNVYILGDFAMGKIVETLPIVELLNGHKILVVGNHDRSFKQKGRDKWTIKYLVEGFNLVLHAHEYPERSVNLEEFRLSHFPYSGDSGNEDRYVDARPKKYSNQWLLHGHVHERFRINSELRMFNVGVDVNNFSPISIDQIREEINVF